MAKTEFPRRYLQVDRLYFNNHTSEWFYTPDGIGVVYFDSKLDALNETDAFGQKIIQIDQPLSDFQ